MVSFIYQGSIMSHCKQKDNHCGKASGVQDIGMLSGVPHDEARSSGMTEEQQAEKRHSSGNGFMLVFSLAILLVFVAPIMLGGVFGGRRYGRGRGRGPVVIWVPGIGGGWGGGRSGAGWGGG